MHPSHGRAAQRQARQTLPFIALSSRTEFRTRPFSSRAGGRRWIAITRRCPASRGRFSSIRYAMVRVQAGSSLLSLGRINGRSIISPGRRMEPNNGGFLATLVSPSIAPASCRKRRRSSAAPSPCRRSKCRHQLARRSVVESADLRGGRAVAGRRSAWRRDMRVLILLRTATRCSRASSKRRRRIGG